MNRSSLAIPSTHTLRLALFSLGLLVLACSSRSPSLDTRTCDKDPTALRALEAAPISCDSNNDCPSGSFCEAASGTCEWSCMQDSDCGPSARCGCDGQCVETTRTFLEPGCTKDPFALGNMIAETVSCATNDDCTLCGSSCLAGLCSFQCIADEECPGSGEVCSYLGVCAPPDEPPPPISIPESVALVTLSPALSQVRPLPGGGFEEATLTVTATTEDSAVAGDAARQPALIVRGLGDLEVACTSSAPFASECELASPWSFAFDGSQHVATRAVRARPRSDSSAQAWSIELIGERVHTSPIGATVERRSAQPLDGVYRGVVFRRDDAERRTLLPVDAVVHDGLVWLRDGARVLSPSGTLRVAPTGTRERFSWFLADDGGELGITAEILAEDRTHTADDGRLDGSFTLTLPSQGQVPWRFELLRAADFEAKRCANDAKCRADQHCSVDRGVCLPGEPFPVVDHDEPGTAFESPRINSWYAAMAPHLDSGPLDVIGARKVERLACYTSAAGVAPDEMELGLGTLTDSGDASCDWDGPPLAARAAYQSELAAPWSVGEMLDHCLAELARAPGGGSLAALARDTDQCVSLARLLPALHLAGAEGVAEAGAAPFDRRGSLLFMYLLKQWIEVHGLVASQGRENRELADVLLGATSPDPSDTGELGTAATYDSLLDHVEAGWELLLDWRYQRALLEMSPNLLRYPDHRRPDRPVFYWPMRKGDKIKRRSGGYARDLAGGSRVDLVGGVATHPSQYSGEHLWLTGDGWAETPLNREHTLDGNLTMAFYVAAWSVDGLRDIVSHTGGSFGARFFPWGTTMYLNVMHHAADGTQEHRFVSLGSSFTQAHLAIVRSVSAMEYRVYRDGSLLATLPFSKVPRAVSAGKLRLGQGASDAAPALQGLLSDVAVWDAELTHDEILAVEERRTDGTWNTHGSIDFPPGAAYAAAYEQRQGVAVRVLDLATAHLELLRAFVAARAGSYYAECYDGGSSPTRDAIARRVGDGVRYALAAEDYAGGMLTRADYVPGKAVPWRDDYDDARARLETARAGLAAEARALDGCDNPLGISEADLPLYFPDVVGATAEFFASSNHLAGVADQAVQRATLDLDDARSAWLAQRNQEYQNALGEADADRRLELLRAQYEEPLMQLCGLDEAPAGGLLEALDSGALDLDTCHVVPTASCLEDAARGLAPATCYRGRVGEALADLARADQEVRVAQQAYGERQRQYDAAGRACAELEDFHAGTDARVGEHLVEMQKLQGEKFVADGMVNLSDTLASAVANPVLGGFSLLSGEFRSRSLKYANAMQSRQAQHEARMLARGHELDVIQCYHQAEQIYFGLDTASHQIHAASLAAGTVGIRLRDMVSQRTALVEGGFAALNREAGRSIPRPDHHFWLDDKVETYQRSFAWARRVTYLTMRAVEYEYQMSSGLRDDILGAGHPDQLRAALMELAETQTSLRIRGKPAQKHPIVLSLRSDILGLGDGVGIPGSKNQDSVARLRERLRSSAYDLFDREGRRLGKGIPFTLQPELLLTARCAERVSTVTASAQLAPAPLGARTFFKIYKRNRFFSQQCVDGDPVFEGGSIRPERNLLSPESTSEPFVETRDFSRADVLGWVNATRDEFERAAFAEGAVTDFAGYGLYGDYILVIPQVELDAGFSIDALEDVLLRFDVVSVGKPSEL